ncbi:DUF1624 domain-containing protein [Roseisolibacter agri]|uniref:Heparan-alpha-glucosaminide N-acetyltransferase catalytic domain-containing protein n=1 Tax=Roseisolibacter agri TaxID=2014610 RepID=A0AA37Q468_9BACT|nr:heparan-alpha-glucosaminide N-acetyltransferase domain-containing protein [Roseisolibacter agri]GLC26049.1 hypothetical protein rosag_25620 [Roseisolibacter agri]
MTATLSPRAISTVPRAAATARRLAAVDALRGVAMVLMTLDHVRDYFGDASVNPTTAATTSVALFLTRWVTHLCAPTFFLLTGTGAYLSARRRDPAALSRFLASRGLWLLVLDTVVLRCLGWQFNVDFQVTLLLVLWALGWAMLVLAVLVRWPARVAGAFGVAMIVGHNLLDGVRAESLGALGPLWMVLHQPGLLLPPPHAVLVAYPLVPWVGVAAAGYALGAVFAWEPARRRAFLARLGAACALAFLVLRAANVYGDPRPWSVQAAPWRTVLSFLDTTKYPPSLLFLLMTLGPALLLLAALDRRVPRWLRPVEVLGRVPLFYFAMHVVLIHLLAVAACWWRYGAVHWMFESPTPDRYPFTQPPGWPSPLPVVYAVWALVVVALWPLCRWFAAVKARRRDWWLGYL